ncbi:MAG: LysE family translocator [Lutibacter sp.]|jgi:threonine/homoserine/homoserine lactone efflux protein|nr:LysE family translocator [Lutibacter sp.]
MAINTEVLFAFITASMALTLMPGPDILYVMVQSISRGKKYGLVTALGLVSGILLHTSLVALGVSAVIQKSPQLFGFLQIAGACYLGWLAYQTYRAPSKLPKYGSGKASKEIKAYYWKGVVMNIINPKVSLFFLAFFPSFLYSNTQAVFVQCYVLGGLFMAQALLIFSLVALLAGRLGKLLNDYPESAVLSKWLRIAVYTGIALLILFSEIELTK